MTEALTKPVSLSFNTKDEAMLFRKECYRQRESLRLIGIRNFDALKFNINRNVLTIRKRKLSINEVL